MDSEYDIAWYSPEWFRLATLQSMTWANPEFLYGLFTIPLIFLMRWLWRYRFNQKFPVALSRRDLKSSRTALLRAVPEFLIILTLLLALIALSRPQKTNERIEQWTEGIDIVIAIDISQSMQIEDFQPNRLNAAKQVAREFIQGRLQDRIGLVVFSGDAFSLAPLTTDYELLENYLEDVSFDMIENRGTAIGSALAVATNRMNESDSKSKVCILLSDGDNTAGNIDPITAAKLANAYGIKIYTIIIGQEGLVPLGKDFFGRPRMVENTIDETTMREIARIGGGEFYRATDNQALVNVFNRIDQYEKAEIKETHFRNTTDFYFPYLSWSIVFFLGWILTRSTFMSNALQD